MNKLVRYLCLALILLIALLAAGCSELPVGLNSSVAPNINAYLPQYEGAKLVSGGGTADTEIRSETRLMTTKDNIYEVTEFFQEEMPRKGWEHVGSGAGKSSFSLSYQRKSMRAEVNVNRIQDITVI